MRLRKIRKHERERGDVGHFSTQSGDHTIEVGNRVALPRVESPFVFRGVFYLDERAFEYDIIRAQKSMRICVSP